jgi:hypothetical protein
MWIQDRDSELLNIDYIIAFIPQPYNKVKYLINGGDNRIFNLKITSAVKFCDYISYLIESDEIKNIKVLRINDDLENIIEGKFKTLEEFNKTN